MKGRFGLPFVYFTLTRHIICGIIKLNKYEKEFIWNFRICSIENGVSFTLILPSAFCIRAQPDKLKFEDLQKVFLLPLVRI